MKRFAFYAFLIVPALLVALGVQQALTLRDLRLIYNEGTPYMADVEDFKIKHIGSQTNGYVVVSFVPADGDTVRRKLGLTVQLAARIMNTNPLPVKYLKGTGNEIVIVQNQQVAVNIVVVNLVIILASIAVTATIAWIWNRKREALEKSETIFEY
jgi:hypothetical protein